MFVPTAASDPRDEDARLIERFRAGDERAFEAIVARHRPRLLAFARRILRSRPDAAEDVVQEALVRAHRALLRDDRTVLLGPWLFKLTRNCALDEISRVKADTVPLDAPAAIAALVHADGPAEQHERRATVRSMLEGIATLPGDQRHALLRREVEGASHADIASELGISGGASRALVNRARTNLVKRDAAIDARCGDVQNSLLRAYRTGRRASAHAYRHLAVCHDCRAYRGQLRAMRDALHALHPGGLLFLGAAVLKAGLAAKGAVAGAVAKSPAGVAALAALSAAAAVGGTLVISAGQPSPATIRSPVLPGGVVAKGAPLPRGTAVVVGSARLTAGTATVRLACPAGHRVADLLPPGAGGITAGYVPATHPGVSRGATIALSGRATGDGRRRRGDALPRAGPGRRAHARLQLPAARRAECGAAAGRRGVHRAGCAALHAGRRRHRVDRRRGATAPRRASERVARGRDPVRRDGVGAGARSLRLSAPRAALVAGAASRRAG